MSRVATALTLVAGTPHGTTIRSTAVALPTEIETRRTALEARPEEIAEELVVVAEWAVPAEWAVAAELVAQAEWAVAAEWVVPEALVVPVE